MFRQRLVATLAVLAVLAACGEDPPEPGVLDIGVRADDGTFQALTPGQAVAVELGANGLNMIVPSLRAVDINPNAPNPEILVEVSGIVMAADIEGSRVDMEDTGDGHALWDLRVPFQANLCCYVCRNAVVRATVRDRSGRDFIGEVDVRLERGGCPDPDACCADESACPDVSLTQVCE